VIFVGILMVALGALSVAFLVALSFKIGAKRSGGLDKFIYGSGTFLFGLVAVVGFGFLAFNILSAG
jgi:hypothetical protein